jgi:NAD(P)-dependent dehydrogenase (short-subunit alcohol dehydrogenase family)
MKSILITGCSSGIGLDSALAFRDAGWKVIASCRKPADCAMMRDHHKIHSICIDYEDETSIIKGFADALEFTNGHLDVLFNNGAYGIPALVEDLPTDALRAIFEANFLWLAYIVTACLSRRCANKNRVALFRIHRFLALPP